MNYIKKKVHNYLHYHDHDVAQGSFFLFSFEIRTLRVQMSWKNRASYDLEGPLELPSNDLAGPLNVHSSETLRWP